MVFCNMKCPWHNDNKPSVTILILIDGFLQYINNDCDKCMECVVTILILIDGFLQYIVTGFGNPNLEMSQSLF